MTNDAELDMVSSRVSSLESRVASVESQGSPDDAGIKAGQDGAPQPTVDPKGRKIWEAEWRQDYGVLIAYVPDNALVIDGANVEIEADAKDGDEVTVTAGSWYLHIYKNESGGGYSADFDDSATGSRDGETAKFNIKIFDIHEDGYVEKQYVVGSIVMGGGSSDMADSEVYDCDGHSITRMGHESTDPTQMWKSNYFHLHGFGYFTVPKIAQPIGTYHEASVLEIDPESTDASSVAFLVREGNSKEPDSNFLGYRKIKFGTGSRLSPFQYVEERRPAEEGEFGADEGASVLVSAKLVQCLFYWEGQLKQLPDFDVSGILGGGTVYLTGKQAAPSASSPNPEWTWALATAEAQAPNGGKVLNFRLYEFAGQKVKIDYRTTFLSLEDTTQKAYYQLKTANGSAKITLDATGLHPKIEMEGEDGNKLSFFAGSSDFAFVLDHTTGTILEIPVDVDSTIKLKRRKLQVRDVSSDGNMAYGETLIDYGKIVLHGINIPPYIVFWSSGKYVASIQPSSSTNALYINGKDYGIVLNGKQNETKISTTPTATLENAANDLNIANLNWISSQLKQLMLDGDYTGVKILATNNVNIKQKKIAAGTGVTVTEKDDIVTVSATGANTSGFTGSRTVLADTQYSGHYLQKRFYTETWKDGVLESSTLGNWITYHTAVEETA